MQKVPDWLKVHKFVMTAKLPLCLPDYVQWST